MESEPRTSTLSACAVAGLAALAGAYAVVGSDTARAGSSCYEERFYPVVTRLEPTEHGFTAVLAGRFRDPERDRAPRIAYDAAGGWKHGWSRAGEAACPRGRCIPDRQGCDFRIPEIELSPAYAQALHRRRDPRMLEQEVYACTEHEGAIYFGIGFYEGEGYGGVGGIGRYVPATGALEVRRPAALLRTPVTHIAFDGRELWLATAGDHECSGTPPTQGLIRYDWQTGELKKESYGGAGLCGFVVHDLLLTDDALWVATDLGLSQKSRGDPEESFMFDARGWSMGWRNFVPDLEVEGGLRHVFCDELYRELLAEVPVEPEPAAPSAFDQTVRSIARFRSR
ncbi:MAG: hypothetical protein GWO02_14935, partial [Gammaproteobacteria bacterium]|nr:hypothetical protein [Gammaproteobacteria bacterium]